MNNLQEAIDAWAKRYAKLHESAKCSGMVVENLDDWAEQAIENAIEDSRFYDALQVELEKAFLKAVKP